MDLRKDLRKGEGAMPFVVPEARAFPITQEPVTVMKKKLRAPLYWPLEARAMIREEGCQGEKPL